MTTTVDSLKFEARKDAIEIAKQYVDDIIEKFPPETYTDNVYPTGPLQTPARNTTTQTEQVVSLMITLADWLVNID